jgi:ComF family protein
VSLARVLSLLAPPVCVGCGLHAGDAEPLCHACRRALWWLGSEPVELAGVTAWAPLAYEGPARAIVRRFKFGGAVRLAHTIAAQIATNAPDGLLDGGTLVPVPLHPARLRRRGFNQAERIAAALARRTGLPVADCLRRTGSSTTQVGRGRAERLASIAGDVALEHGPPAPRLAVLVDDVITTGATLAACASALRTAGCHDVRVVAYARTPGR